MDMKLEDHINGATIEQAKAWYNTSEKWCYCIDLMMISGQPLYADKWVEALEKRFDELLDEYSRSEIQKLEKWCYCVDGEQHD